MPELPEVETSRRGIAPHIQGRVIQSVVIRQPQLRWPIDASLPSLLANQTLNNIGRRGKYLLLETAKGTVLLHLGMSGHLRIVSADRAPGKHDHVDFVFGDDVVLRLNDPRKFGAVLWQPNGAGDHPLLAKLGPEPLSDQFDGDYLWQRARKRSTPVKSLIMDSQVVVGVGNIYASESLFFAGLRPMLMVGDLDLHACQALALAIKQVLAKAIEQGGTTLRDFSNPDGKPGYFRQSLAVYGREGEPCHVCQSLIQCLRIGQRSSYFCPLCQL